MSDEAPGLDAGAGLAAESGPDLPEPSEPILDPLILRYAVFGYLVVLPIGHLFVMPVNGAMATLSDVFLAIVILAGIADLGRMIPHYLSRRREGVPLLPVHRAFHVAALFFMAFSVWGALGGAWGVHTGYALTKGVAYAALGLGALAIIWCGAEWGKAADAWLLGTAISLVVTWVFALVGPDPLHEQVLFRGGSIRGLPAPRLSGPFLHPTMFGDYLVVSGALLWARWRPLSQDFGVWATVGAWVLGMTLFLTVSSAWIGAGVLLAVIGLLTMRQRHGRVSLDRKRPGPVILLVAGVTIFTTTLMGLLLPMGFNLGGLSISASGIRWGIWASAWQAVLESPLAGVGASPYLAEAMDPLSGSSTLSPWDAHNLYLSLLGQYGLVGFALITGAVVILVRALIRAGTTRRNAALLLALFAVAVHGIAVASEDFRHVWALLGMVGLAGMPEWAQGRWWKAGEMWQGGDESELTLRVSGTEHA